jgi:hypothetical protein
LEIVFVGFVLVCFVGAVRLGRLLGLADEMGGISAELFSVKSCVTLATEPATCPSLRASELKNGSLGLIFVIGSQIAR